MPNRNESRGRTSGGLTMRTSTEERFLLLLAGIGLGAGIALLFAPKTGRDMRRYLSRLAEEGRDRVNDSTQDVMEKGKEVYERSKAVVDEALDFVERGRRTILRS